MDDLLDREFLEDYASFGVYNHKLVADILSVAMDGASKDAMKILSVKIYAEFISAIEDFAGLCIAIRDREKMSILGSYMFFGTKFKGRKIIGPGRFLSEAIDAEGDVASLFDFPGLSELVGSKTDDGQIDYKATYSFLTESIMMAASWYRIENRMAVGTYNKTKHGFVVTRGFNKESPFFDSKGSEAAVLYSEPSTAKDGQLMINGSLIDTELGIREELDGIDRLLETTIQLIKLYLDLNVKKSA